MAYVQMARLDQVTKQQVGLDKVDNTSDMAKPVSNLQRQALSNVINSAQMTKITNDDGSYKINISSGDFLASLVTTDPGMYTVIVNGNSGSATNAPGTGLYKGLVIIEKGTDDKAYIYCILFHDSTGNMYINTYYGSNDKWLGWVKTANDSDVSSLTTEITGIRTDKAGTTYANAATRIDAIDTKIDELESSSTIDGGEW